MPRNSSSLKDQWEARSGRVVSTNSDVETRRNDSLNELKDRLTFGENDEHVMKISSIECPWVYGSEPTGEDNKEGDPTKT